MDIRWYLNRLKKMSIYEINTKIVQSIREPFVVERLRKITKGLKLRDVELPFESMPLVDLWDEDILSVADRVKQGDRWVLGLGWRTNAQWHWTADLHSGKHWPSVPSRHINYRVPGTEIRLTWELNRFHDLTVLAQAFWMTEDSTYLDEVVSLFEEWQTINPIGQGPNWISAMESAIRIVNMTWVARMIRNASPKFVEKLGLQVEVHKQHINHHLSLGSSANNHLLLEWMGLIYSEAFWCDPKQAHRVADYIDRFTAELERQTGRDGMNREMSSHYHLFVTEAALHVRIAGLANNVRNERLDAIVQKMQSVVSALTIEEGICQFGDDDGGAIVRLAHQKWEHLLSGMKASPWFSVCPEVEDLDDLTIFDGVVVARRGMFHVVVDCGDFGLPPLYAHAHDDTGSIYVGFGGHWLIVDPGTGSYFRNPSQRMDLASAHAHNWSLVQGVFRGKMSGAFCWEGAQPEVLVDKLSHSEDGITIVMKQGSVTRTIHIADKVAITDVGTLPMSGRMTMSPRWKMDDSAGQRPCFRFHEHKIEFVGPYVGLGKISQEFGGFEKESIELIWEDVMSMALEIRQC